MLSTITSRTFGPSVRRQLRAVFVSFLMVFFAAACATVPDDPDARQAYYEVNDPLEPLNRYILDINLGFDKLLLFPIADTYRGAVPKPVREGIRNFLDNLRSPIIFINDLLQGETERAGNTLGRFLTNTFFGLGGIFDVSGLPKHNEDFGQTLAVWGVSEGPYFVAPLLGPKPPRDLAGFFVDKFLFDPVEWMAANDVISANIVFARTVVDTIDTRARNIDTFDEIERSSIDLYATLRSLYRQRREEEIRNGAPSAGDDLDDLFDEDESELDEDEPAENSE